MMNRNFRVYAHEAESSHTQEAIVASAWTLLLVVMFAASLLDRSSKPVTAAELNAGPAALSPY